MELRRLIVKLWDRCQMECVFCVNSDGPAAGNSMPDSTIDDIFSTIRPGEVEFTGGETTLYRSRLLNAVRKARGISPSRIMINTNMELLTPSYIDELVLAGLTHVHFALYTLDPGKHMELRANQKADLSRVTGNLDYILGNTGLKVVAEYVPMQPNVGELQDIYRFLSGRAASHPGRIEALEIGNLIQKGRALRNRDRLLLDRSDEQSALAALGYVMLELGKPVPVQVFCYPSLMQRGFRRMGYDIFPCDAGNSMFYISTDGKVWADNFSGHPVCSHYRDLASIALPGYKCPLLAIAAKDF